MRGPWIGRSDIDRDSRAQDRRFAERGGRETRVESRAAAGGNRRRLQAGRLNAPQAACAGLLQFVAAAGIPVRDAWLDEQTNLLLSLTSVPEFGETAELLRAAGASSVRTDIATVSAIAVGVGRLPDVLARALHCLPASALATSLSPLRLCTALPSSEAPQLEHAPACALQLAARLLLAQGQRGCRGYGAVAVRNLSIVRRRAQGHGQVALGREHVALDKESARTLPPPPKTPPPAAAVPRTARWLRASARSSRKLRQCRPSQRAERASKRRAST